MQKEIIKQNEIRKFKKEGALQGDLKNESAIYQIEAIINNVYHGICHGYCK